ncbi:hypothetical protein KR018_006260, partial [Drosophila ironensis]
CRTLNPDEVLCACKYPKKLIIKEPETGPKKEPEPEPQEDESGLETPEWRAEYNLGRRYQPSHNIAPSDITPVIVSAAHFSDAEDKKRARVVMPMMWGMIPFWHKGDYKRHGLTTNNCRLEHMLDSKLYRGPFKRGQRCVVVCEGFYEWQTTGPVKKPSERDAYLVYVPQAGDAKIYDKSTWSPADVKLLRMAGLFDVWEDENGDKMYSYSIITFQSTDIMSWMHYRMPAILETEQQMNDWLDFKRVSEAEALATLRPAKSLLWHRVAKLVNNSRNKSVYCNKPIQLAKPAKPPMNRVMKSWLQVRKRREEQLLAEQSESESESSEDERPAAVKRRSSDGSSFEEAAKRACFRDYKTALLQDSSSD